MNTKLLADLTAIASRALEEIEERLREEGRSESDSAADVNATPVAGSAESMLMVLSAFEETTPETGLSQRQASDVAREAGMNPRGLAGYFAAGLLAGDMKTDRRWITEGGLERLRRLRDR